MPDVQNLETYAIIGFDGSAIRGLKVHPDGHHIIYPMGNKVCIQNWKTKKMQFLSGHTMSVSTVAVSKSGKMIGSGQINHIGFKAGVKIWNFQKNSFLGGHELHKVRVEALVFTSDEKYLISLGGRDDGSLVIWDCEQNVATGTAQAARLTTGDAITVAPFNRRTVSFVTGGDSNLRVWSIRPATKTLDVQDVALGKLRRCVRCIAISPDDTYGIAGTTTGDMIKFALNYPEDANASTEQCKPALIGCLAKCGPWKKGRRPGVQCYSQGIESVLIMHDGCLIVGAGDGTIDVLDEINWKGPLPKSKVAEPNHPHFETLRTCKLEGSITSLELMESPTLQGTKRMLLVGTRSSEIYAINVATFQPTLVVTCHRCAINSICFPNAMSGVFATAGSGDVRVWNLETCQELLRIVVPNFTCSDVKFTYDGKAIITGWNDGNIRAFTPLTGRLIYCIYNTHNKGASALDITKDGRTLVSGGCAGQVRVWDIKPTSQSLKAVLKEHKSPVSAIQTSPNDKEAVSAGTDGSCIIWDLMSLTRRQVMYANTLFMCVCFEPQGCQLLTGGTDRRVAYWETGSGNLARELEASKVGAINGLHISENGKLFITGGNDQMVKMWQYQEGIYTHMGLGHAGAVTCCRFSPDMRYAVSCCAAGSIIVWKVPPEYIPKPSSAPTSAAAPTADELRLPLETGAGDRHKIPAAPNKVTIITIHHPVFLPLPSSAPTSAAAPTADELRLPLETGAGDRHKIPAAPNKVTIITIHHPVFLPLPSSAPTSAAAPTADELRLPLETGAGDRHKIPAAPNKVTIITIHHPVFLPLPSSAPTSAAAPTADELRLPLETGAGDRHKIPAAPNKVTIITIHHPVFLPLPSSAPTSAAAPTADELRLPLETGAGDRHKIPAAPNKVTIITIHHPVFLPLPSSAPTSAAAPTADELRLPLETGAGDRHKIPAAPNKVTIITIHHPVFLPLPSSAPTSAAAPTADELRLPLETGAGDRHKIPAAPNKVTIITIHHPVFLPLPSSAPTSAAAPTADELRLPLETGAGDRHKIPAAPNKVTIITIHHPVFLPLPSSAPTSAAAPTADELRLPLETGAGDRHKIPAAPNKVTIITIHHPVFLPLPSSAPTSAAAPTADELRLPLETGAGDRHKIPAAPNKVTIITIHHPVFLPLPSSAPTSAAAPTADELRLPLETGAGDRHKIPAAPNKVTIITIHHPVFLPLPSSAPTSAAAPTADELRLPLETGAGDRHKIPAAPNKEEKIAAIDTTRSSVHSCCPCDTRRSDASDAPGGSGGKQSGVRCCAKPCAKLPTKTTSKEFISGSGDRKT